MSTGATVCITLISIVGILFLLGSALYGVLGVGITHAIMSAYFVYDICRTEKERKQNDKNKR